jgi:hypothetical protein
MIKFAIRCNDKVIIIEGAVPRALGHWLRKGFWRNADQSPGTFPDNYFRGTAMQEGGLVQGDRLQISRAWIGESAFSTPPGSFLNAKPICHLGRYLYTFHTVNETDATASVDLQRVPANPKLIEWDGIEENINPNIFPSGQGGRIIFGYSSAAANRLDQFAGMPTKTCDAAMLPFKGHVVGIAASIQGSIPYTTLLNEGDEAGQLDIFDDTIVLPAYYSFWFNPQANNGSGLITWSFYAKGDDTPSVSQFSFPSWMLDLSNYNAQNQYYMFDQPFNNYNMTDAIEYNDWIYACNGCHLVRFGSGYPNFEILYDTGQSPYTAAPKWLEKHNGNLYMLESSGVVSQIIPSGDSVIKNNLIDLSYVNPGNVRYGGIHAREWGVERATKNAIVSYDEKLHVMMGMGSGAYHFVSSGNMSVWEDRTSDLPDLLKNNQCNIYTYEDLHDGNLYVLASPMVADNGIFGVITFGDKVTGTSHLYSYNGSAWTKHAWFPVQSFWHAGGFLGFDYYGPHVLMPSGGNYPVNYGNGSGITSITPVLFKCKDYAVVDYKLIDELSRNIDVDIQYSLDDGCTWSNCTRFKDYSTLEYLGEGTEILSASPSGEWHNFYWDFVKAVGYNVNYPYTKLRIIPSISNTQ